LAGKTRNIRVARCTARLALIWLLASGVSRAAAQNEGFSLISSGDAAIEVQFELPAWSVSPAGIGGRDYTRIAARGSQDLAVEGFPLLPEYRVLVALPASGEVRAHWSLENPSRLAVQPPPPFETVPEKGPDRERAGSSQSPAFAPGFLSGGVYPPETVIVGKPARLRDLRVVEVVVRPFSYDPAAGTLLVVRRVRVTLDISAPSLTAVPGRRPSQAGQLFESLYRGTLLNYQSSTAWRLPAGGPALRAALPFQQGGRWVSVRIDSTDIYAVSPGDLQNAGVDVQGINPASFRLFSGGGRMLDEDPQGAQPELKEVALRVTGAGDGSFDPEDRIIFYGQALDRFFVTDSGTVSSVRHRYDSRAVYWLTWGEAQTGLRIAEYPTLPASGAALPSSAETWTHREENTQYLTDVEPAEPRSNPAPDYWAWVLDSDAGGSIERSFDLEREPGSGESFLRCEFYGILAGNLATYRVSLNGTELSSGFNYALNARTTVWIAVPPGLLRKQDNRFSLSARNQALGFFELRVNTPLTLGAGERLTFHQAAAGGTPGFQFSDIASQDFEVYDVTAPEQPVLVTGLDRTTPGTVRFAAPPIAGTVRSFVALTGRAWAAPSAVRAENLPGLRNMAGAEYVVLAPGELVSQAEKLAAFHAGEYSTAVVAVEDVYNEFSFGPADPAALRNFLKYAFERWPVRPQFVVLLGDGHNDFRGYTAAGRSKPNLILPYITQQDLEVEEWYVRFDNGGLPQMALGRIPAQRQGDAEAVVQKITRYGSGADAGDWVKRVILVADDGYDLGGICDQVTNHVPGSEQLDSLIPADFERKKVYLDQYQFDPPGIGTRKPAATRDLLNWWNRGALLVNYLGHGSPFQWSQELAFDVERDLPLLTNGSRLPLVLNSSCSIGHFDDYRSEAMAEKLVTFKSGGAVAVYAGTRVTFAYQNLALNRAFMLALFQADPGPIGAAALQARISLGGVDRGNAERYALFGDPGLRLHQPARRIKFEADQVRAYRPGEKVSFSGRVEDAAGNLDAGFSGVGQIKFNGGVQPVTIPYQCNWYGTSIERSVFFNEPAPVLFDGSVTVTGGRFSGALVLPVSLAGSQPGDSLALRRGMFLGYGTSDQGDAAGAGGQVEIAGAPAVLTDSAGPRISLLYQDRELSDGERVAATEPLVLVLKDENGINTTDRPGVQVSLEVDEGTTYAADLTPFFRYRTDSYQEGTVSVDLQPVGTGLHNFRFRATDNAQNASRFELMLYVTGASEALSLSGVLNYPNPFRDETFICFEISSPADVLIRFFTVAGRPVRELRLFNLPAGFNTVRWDGRDEYQQNIANGIYLYKISCKAVTNGFAGTQEVEAIGKALLSR
jgi:hypothetical protein